MASAIETLKAFARSVAAPLSSLERRVLAETGLPIVWEPNREPVTVAHAAELAALQAAGDLPGLAAAFDRLFAAKAFCGTGRSGDASKP